MTTRVTKNDRRTVTAILAALLVLGAITTSADAVPQIESTYGGQSPWYQAEINALGATGAAGFRGGMSTILNPAGLARVEHFRYDIGLNASHHEEDRFMPVFDSFDNRVVDMAIASNQNTWWNAGFAMAGRLESEPIPLCFGLSLADRYPFAYRFEEELRDPSPFSDPRDRILEERLYEVKGTLRTLSMGLATELAQRYALGVSIHAAFGERQETWRVRDRHLADGDQSYDDRSAWSLGGFNATFGAQARVSDRVTLGVAYETRLEVDGDYETSSFAAGDTVRTEASELETLRYPAYWRFGGAFYPRSDPRTAFTVDVVYSDWAKLEDSRLGQDGELRLEEVVDVRIGLEHTFYNEMDLRFGFRRYDSYADDLGGNSVWSAGGGFPVLEGEFSLSVEMNKLQSYEPHIFGYPEDYVAEDEARVDDRRVRVGVSWSREF
jgi:opacity protein-like surface antigen